MPQGAGVYARELLGRFAERAFRRPVDDATKERLAALAEGVSARGQTFEAGVAQAMAAVLTSPRFLFREEGVEAGLDRPVSAGRRVRPGVAALLLLVVVDARRRALPTGPGAQASQATRGPGRSDARRFAVGGIHPQFRGAMAAGPRHRLGHHQCAGRDLSRPVARPRGREATRAIPRARSANRPTN